MSVGSNNCVTSIVWHKWYNQLKMHLITTAKLCRVNRFTPRDRKRQREWVRDLYSTERWILILETANAIHAIEVISLQTPTPKSTACCSITVAAFSRDNKKLTIHCYIAFHTWELLAVDEADELAKHDDANKISKLQK